MRFLILFVCFQNTPSIFNKNERDIGAVNFVADPISYENYVTRLEKFRNNKAKMEKENKKKLNIKDFQEVQKKHVPRILNEIHSPKNEKYFSNKDLDCKETIKIKSLDKVNLKLHLMILKFSLWRNIDIKDQLMICIKRKLIITIQKQKDRINHLLYQK